MCDLCREAAAWEPLPAPHDDHAPPSFRPRRVGRIGRVRVPIAGPYRPWATLYRLPDGRALWELRLWEDGRPVRVAVPSATLRGYARRNRLDRLAAEIEALEGR